jgi:fibro-slime domain-containing protein
MEDSMVSVNRNPKQRCGCGLQCAFAFLVPAFFSQVFATDTTWVDSVTMRLVDTVPSFTVKVTYYDFHKDGSNPEFEIKARRKEWKTVYGPNSALLLDTLDGAGNPVPNPAIIDSGYLVENVNRWFRPWVPGDTLQWVFPPETTLAVITYSSAKPDTIETFFGTIIQYPQKIDTSVAKPDTIRSDTLLKNIALQDSFVFHKFDYAKIDTAGFDTVKLQYILDTIRYKNVYQVDNMRNTFFPIDGRGFDTQNDTSETLMVSKHNFGFTMKMENTFIFKDNLVLRIMGDDDIWVFINGKLALDLGGLHSTSTGEISLDSLSAKLGLTVGGSYDFVLFFAERCSPGSNLSVVTNIDFTDKTTGRNVFERYVTSVKHEAKPVYRGIPSRKTALKFGRVVELFAMPENASELTADIFDAGGKKLVTYRTSVENAVRSGFAVDNKFQSGIFFVRLTCSTTNGNGKALVAHRALMIR